MGRHGHIELTIDSCVAQPKWHILKRMHLRQYILLFEDVVAFRKGGWFLSRQLLATDEVRTVAASLMQTAQHFKREAI